MCASRISRLPALIILALGAALWSPLSCAASASTLIAEERSHAFPFVMPTKDQLRASKKKVFAHYFTPFPRSLDNVDPERDYYTGQYLRPEGENGKFAVMGGFLRERPIPRMPVNDKNWEFQDACWEVSQAAAAGLDGFCVDLLADDGPHWQRTLTVMRAAEKVAPGFVIIPMPDMDGELALHPEKLVPMIRQLAKEPSACRLADGRLVLAPYNTQKRPAAWWQEQLALLKSEGTDVAFFPCFQFLDQHWNEFLPSCYGLTEWGDRTVQAVLATPNHAKSAHAAGKLWMMPVSPQDMRPKDLIAREAENTKLYRTMWEQAIAQDADWVQVITWNDYSESTEIAPSTAIGYVFYDLTAYYVAAFKTGKRPVIRRDAIFAVYRTQPTTAELTQQKQGCAFIPVGSESNRVEMLAFLTTPATLSIRFGNNHYDQPGQPGLTSISVPLLMGKPAFSISRGNKATLSLTGPWEIVPRAEYQDLLYHAASVLADH